MTTRGYRTPVFVAPQLEAVVEMLNDIIPAPPFTIDFWFRPKEVANQTFLDPPYLLCRVYPSADQMGGSLADSQRDSVIRIQLLAAGKTEIEAMNVTDWARQHMQRDNLESYLAAENRAVMDLRLMVSSAGLTRDDDLPTPLYQSSDLYELRTTRLTSTP
jgi:hypothetical protein